LFPLSPPRELVFAIHDVARLMRTYADQRARELNMTRAKWVVLTRLRRSEGVKQRELADSLEMAPISLARLVDKLAACGLIERRADAADRRANRLYLTEKAAPTLDRLDALAESVTARALDGVDAAELARLLAGLLRIKTNLKHELSGGV
jgi:MarR family transcriptional regulator for hemolysin